VRIRVRPEQAAEATALLNSREDIATGDDGSMAGEPVDNAPGPGELVDKP
jgi:hypothetical protein